MNATTLPRLQIVVLEAGLSSRLGRPKGLVTVGSVSLLRRALILASSLGPYAVTVVLPPRASRCRAEIRHLKVAVVDNPERSLGLSTSVRRGIAAARCSGAVLLLPMDLAVLTRRDLSRLLCRWRSAPRRVIARRLNGLGRSELDSRGSACRGSRRSAGAPLILPKWLFARARTASGDVGLKDLINALPAEQITLVDLPSAELDVDTAADLEAARHR